MEWQDRDWYQLHMDEDYVYKSSQFCDYELW